MRIRVGFTVHVDEKHFQDMLDLCAADDRSEVRDFIRNEAAESITQYLEGNGIPVDIVHH